MAIDFMGLAVILGAMVYLPFLVMRTAKSGDQKALKHPERKRWLVVAICAGEIAGFSLFLEFALKYLLPRIQPNVLPFPMQCLGFIVLFVGATGVLWAGIKFDQLRYD